MKRIRIAIYSGTIPSTTFIERLIEALAEQGFEVILFGRIKQLTRYTSPNVKVVGNRDGWRGVVETIIRFAILRFTESGRYKKLKKHLGYGPLSGGGAFRSWQVYAPVILNLPDVFHVQWAKSVSDWIFLKDKFGLKVVLSLRGTHISISPLADENLARKYRQTFPRIDAFHSVSFAILEEALCYAAKRENSHIIYSGLKVGDMKLQKKKRNEPVKLIAVGRFHWKKGYQYLFDAMTLLKRRSIKCTLTLIAQGDLPEEILFQLHDLNLNDHVIWIKGLQHEQVIQQMVQHDALILPSLSEGIANVVLEAMSVGLPVISTDCDGMTEVLRDGVNGFLVPVRNPEGIANAIEKLNQTSDDEIKQIRVNARTSIEHQFNMKNNIEAFAEMYKRVVA